MKNRPVRCVNCASRAVIAKIYNTEPGAIWRREMACHELIGGSLIPPSLAVYDIGLWHDISISFKTVSFRFQE